MSFHAITLKAHCGRRHGSLMIINVVFTVLQNSSNMITSTSYNISDCEVCVVAVFCPDLTTSLSKHSVPSMCPSVAVSSTSPPPLLLWLLRCISTVSLPWSAAQDSALAPFPKCPSGLVLFCCAFRCGIEGGGGCHPAWLEERLLVPPMVKS